MSCAPGTRSAQGPGESMGARLRLSRRKLRSHRRRTSPLGRSPLKSIPGHIRFPTLPPILLSDHPKAVGRETTDRSLNTSCLGPSLQRKLRHNDGNDFNKLSATPEMTDRVFDHAEADYRAIFDTANDAIFVHDAAPVPSSTSTGRCPRCTGTRGTRRGTSPCRTPTISPRSLTPQASV